jgi:long-subunit fatty acid transport protein
MRKFLLALSFSGIVFSTFAQETLPSNSCLMFMHAGYGFLPQKTSGLTNSSADYINKLSSGTIWNAQAYFHRKIIIVGLLYSGYTAKGSLENSSDKIITNYFAPQFGFYFPLADGKFNIGFNLGVGCMAYRNNSVVFNKPRIVNGCAIGGNFGIKGAYNITQNLGISVDISIIGAELYKTYINYHDEVIKVKYRDDSQIYLEQITFSFGLKYSFN